MEIMLGIENLSINLVTDSLPSGLEATVVDIKKLLSGGKNKISAGKQRTKAKNKAILLNRMQSLF